MTDVRSSEIERVFREHYGRAVSVLVRACGDIDTAEEAVQDAFVAAVERWPSAGVPPNPAAWIITTARNRAIDRFRRESTRDDRHAEAMRLHDAGDPETEEESVVRDDQLRLIFTCCHPALATSVQVALTLRLLGGLTTPEIARAFLVPEATMAQRLVRAKGKILNEGYTASSGDRLIRDDLCSDAIRLGRLLAELLPDEPEPQGLLALMLLLESRRAARTTADGAMVLLADQDRGLWDRRLIAEGQAIVRQCLARNEPGPYQIQAAINAVHSDAPRAEATDWRQIVALYDQHLASAPSPVVALNRAVAVAEVEGAEAALALVEGLDLGGYRLYHAIRADLLRRVGRRAEASLAYGAAIALTENEAERDFLERRRRSLVEPSLRPSS
jgi:RNA polymerase sigma-70 factor (ECF subfamily)